LENAPASRIASVTGTVDESFHQFNNTDFELTDDQSAIRWLQNTLPDADSIFFVDYYPASAQSPITDRNVGSVARTLVEAIGREIATLYEHLELVYKSGFIDLAEGAALDFVVALLDVERIRAGRQVGEVVFARSTPAPGDITIPSGTLLATGVLQGDQQERFEFETTAIRTMRRGQTEVAAPIRFRPTPEQQVALASGQVPGGAISLIPKPIVGIETVTNPEPTTRGAEDESDAQLRQRAKQALAEAGKSTVEALRAAVLRHGPGVNVVVQDMPRGVAGEVGLVIDGATDDTLNAIAQSVLATKAAGIVIETQRSERLHMTLSLRLETHVDVQLSGDEERRIRAATKMTMANAVNALNPGEDIFRNTLVALSLSEPQVRGVVFTGLTLVRNGLGMVDESNTRFRDRNGGLANLANFDHISVGRIEKVDTTEDDITIELMTGQAEMTTAVRITVVLRGNATAAGEAQGIENLRNRIKPQVETLIQGFLTSPERGSEIRLDALLTFLEQGSGLFTLKPFSDANPESGSFFIAEFVATGLVQRHQSVVRLAEKEQAEFVSVLLEIS
jgi:uncharacterized phage protein gp47/JayE